MTRGLCLKNNRGRIRCYLNEDDPLGCAGVPWATHHEPMTVGLVKGSEESVPLCDGHDWRQTKLLREIFEEANDV